MAGYQDSDIIRAIGASGGAHRLGFADRRGDVGIAARLAGRDAAQLTPDGFLNIGFRGPQPELGDRYSNNGSMYIASVGLLVSTIGTLCPERRAEAAGLGMKSWISGNLASAMTGAWIGLVSWGA